MRDEVYVAPLIDAGEVVALMRAEGHEGSALDLFAAFSLYVSSGLLALSQLLAGEAAA